MADIANFNIDSLLDGTLDDLADIPEFKPYPAGTHKCHISITQKLINKKVAFEVAMKAVETIELANASDTPLEKGAETSVAYFMDNELGQGQFKAVLASLAAHFGAKSNRELIADAQNLEVLVVTGVRQNKEKTKSYTNIVEIAVV